MYNLRYRYKITMFKVNMKSHQTNLSFRWLRGIVLAKLKVRFYERKFFFAKISCSFKTIIGFNLTFFKKTLAQWKWAWPI